MQGKFNTFDILNTKIIELNKAQKNIEVLFKGLEVAKEIMHIMGIPYDQIEDGEDMLEKAFSNSQFKNQKVEKWFAQNPIIDGARVALNHYDKGKYPIESKFYMLSDSPRKEKIAYTTQLFPNWEDGDMYMIPQYKVGVDFFLNPKAKSLLFVITKKGTLRVIEFSNKLSHTQIEILNSIQNCALYSGLDIKTKEPIPFEPQRTIHTTIWNALELKEVNKKFYIGIAEHFTLLCQYLKDHIPGGVEPSTIDATSRIFANRIINRLLFVWFLRKKGIINKKYNYFDIGSDDSSDYYENKLKPLFFKTLNIPVEDRSELGDLATPYLNGGLFEAQESDWPNTRVPFPAGWFNSLYEHLDKFNFTTDESSSEYEQVAIDPEMLGRVFENLLASIVSETANAANERNNKGAFYTPREIVSYMCKISLKEYFKRSVSSDKFYEGIDKLIDLSDNLFISQKSTGQADLWGVNSNQVRLQLVEAINKLKILDPACGSGAFPIGMLQLLLKTCDRLSLIYDNKLEKMRLVSGIETTDAYNTKLFIIRNCLYGVDIEPMAAEIARLRAWLSLIIDENTDIEPLPNLDFNFVCANTLVKLPPKEEQGDLFTDTHYEERFQRLKDLYFNTHGKKDKDILRSDFYELYNENDKTKDDHTKTSSKRFKMMATWDPFKNTKASEFFDPEVMFNVSKFPIVIGNPPYVRLGNIKEPSKELYKLQNFATYEATGDMYCLFIEKGLGLCTEGGILTFITSNKWMRAAYGERLRGFLAKHNPIYLIDFGGTKVFDSATVDTDIILVSNEENKLNTKACRIYFDKNKGETLDNLSDYIKQNASSMKFDTSDSWAILSSIELSIKRKIESAGTPLKDWGNISINYGIKTGYDKAFIISAEARKEILNNCKDVEERKRTEEIIRPILKGRDIKRYSYNWAGLYIIATFPSRHYNIDDYPAIKSHLLSFDKRVLAQSGEKEIDGITGKNARKKTNNKWFETQDSISYWDDFSKPKIIYPETTQSARFAYDKTGLMLDKTCFMMIIENPEYIMATLNSNLFEFAYKKIFSSVELGSSGYQYNKHALVKLPVMRLEKQKEEDAYTDEFFYHLYKLSEKEVSYIENQLKPV